MSLAALVAILVIALWVARHRAGEGSKTTGTEISQNGAPDKALAEGEAKKDSAAQGTTDTGQTNSETSPKMENAQATGESTSDQGKLAGVNEKANSATPENSAISAKSPRSNEASVSTPGNNSGSAKKSWFGFLFNFGKSKTPELAKPSDLGTPSGGAPSLPNGAAAPGANGTPPVAEVKAPEAPLPPCILVSYHHKKMANHDDEETCSHHKNLLKVAHTPLNPSSICVRVNNTPVAYEKVKGKSDEIMIGSIAGPHAKITVQYCMGKNTCTDECKVPKDEFMDAIGGGEEQDTVSAQAGRWDPNDPTNKDAELGEKVDREVKKQLAEGNALPQEGTYLFKDWISENEGPGCVKNVSLK